MKKLLLLMVFALMGSSAFSAIYNAEVDGVTFYFTTNTDDETTVRITNSYSQTSARESYYGEIVIPSEIEYEETTYKVTQIATYAFSNCYSLTSVSIPESVTDIGLYAFYACSSLISVSIPEGVTNIGSDAFSRCTSLTSVEIPSTVTSIDYQLFSGCTSLTTVILYEGLTYIGTQAFYGCSVLKNIEIPSTVTEISNGAFTQCDLRSVEIPTGVTIIDYNVFNNCSRLASVTFLGEITSIGGSAFLNCSALTEMIIPESVVSIGSYAFVNTGLISVEIPESVETIGSMAFQNCDALTSVTLSEGLVSIGDGAFRWDSKLESIEFPSTLTSIAQDAFGGCTNLKFEVIPENVTSIGATAFSSCSTLTTVVIPAGINSIGKQAFSTCNGLTSIYCEATDPESCILGLNIYSGNSDCYLYVPEGCKDAYYESDWSESFDYDHIVEGYYVPPIEVPTEITEAIDVASGLLVDINNYIIQDSNLTNKFFGEYSILQNNLSSIIAELESATETRIFTDEQSEEMLSELTNLVVQIEEFVETVENYQEEIDIFGDSSAVPSITSSAVSEISRYNIAGQRLLAPTKGINIIRYSDGTTQKVLVK